MKYYFIWWTYVSFLRVFEESLAEVPDIKIEDQCIKYNGNTKITCTFSTLTIDNTFYIYWYGTGGKWDVLVFSGIDVNILKYNGANTATTLSLTVKNISVDDIGQYTCEFNGNSAQIIFNQTYLEDIKCVGSEGGTEQSTINIETNNVAGISQEAVVTNIDNAKTYHTSCSYDPVGQFTDGTCKFTGIAPGQYSYTVYSHGNCELSCTNATDIITVDGSPITIVITTASDIPPTVAPSDDTTNGLDSIPEYDDPPTVAPTSDDTITSVTTPEATKSSNNNLTIVYGVCGTLGGLVVILFAFSAYLICKNKKMRSRSKEYKQRKANNTNRSNGNIPPDYDYPALSNISSDYDYIALSDISSNYDYPTFSRVRQGQM